MTISVNVNQAFTAKIVKLILTIALGGLVNTGNALMARIVTVVNVMTVIRGIIVMRGQMFVWHRIQVIQQVHKVYAKTTASA